MKSGNTNCKKCRYLSLFNMLSMKKYGPIIEREREREGGREGEERRGEERERERERE